MQFYVFNIRLKLRHQKWRKLRVTLPVNMHAFFSVCSLTDDIAITSKPIWKLKHTNSIMEYFEYFCQILSKSILVIFSYTVSKLVRFLRHGVDTYLTLFNSVTVSHHLAHSHYYFVYRLECCDTLRKLCGLPSLTDTVIYWRG